jgi:DNA repair exonuclease SbcCD ATPase subunit
VGEAELNELRQGLVDVEQRLVDAASLRAELEALGARLDERAEPLEARLSELASQVGEASGVRAELERLRTRLEEIAVAAAAGLRTDIEALSARLDEVSAQAAQTRPDPEGLESLGIAVDRLAAQREQAERLLQERISRLESEVELGSRSDEGALLEERVIRLESEVELSSQSEERLRAELVPLVREASEANRRQLTELAARVDEATGFAGALDAVSGRVRQLEGQAAEAGALDGRLRDLAEALEASAASLRADQDSLREQLDRQLREVAVASDLPARVARLEEQLVDAGSLEQRLQESLQALAEQLSAAARDADAEIRESLNALAGEAARTAREQSAGFDARLADVSRQIAAVAELEHRLEQVEQRVLASESLGARLDGLEQRVDQSGEVEERLRETLVPLAEASEAIRADQAALRDRLGKAFARLSSVDSIAGKLAELEQRLSEGEELEARLEATLGKLVESAGAGLRTEQGVLRKQIEVLAREVAASRVLAERLAQIEQWQGDNDAARERMRELLDQHATALEKLDEIAPLGEQLDAVATRLRGVEGDLAPRAALDQLEARVRAESSQAAERAESLRAELEELGSRLAAEIAASGERAVAEAHGRTAEEVRRQAERLDELDARLTESDARAQIADQVEALELRLEQGRERASAMDKAVQEASRQAGEAVSALRSELTERHAETEQITGARLHELERRLETAGDASATMAARIDAAEGRALEAMEDLARKLEQMEEKIKNGALRGTERALAVEHELRNGLAAQADALEQHVAATAAHEEALLELANRTEERDAASIDAREELREQVERLASSLGWRLERVEESLARDATADLRESIEELSSRLDEQSALSAEQVRVTEKALRKGLKALGSQLAASEEAYVTAGDALRRSIERLGQAIDETDRVIEEREADPAPIRKTGTFLAFAPSGDGYRLVEVDGPMPELGGHLTIPEIESELRVTRIGASPLPLDERPCAYLERRPPE